jgi:hypothetical protein
VEKKKESSNEPISDNDSNATIEYDEMYDRPQSPLHSNDIIENETTSDKRRTFTPLSCLSFVTDRRVINCLSVVTIFERMNICKC